MTRPIGLVAWPRTPGPDARPGRQARDIGGSRQIRQKGVIPTGRAIPDLKRRRPSAGPARAAQVGEVMRPQRSPVALA